MVVAVALCPMLDAARGATCRTPGPVDPFNCAVGIWPSWAPDKQSWCCRIHHICDDRPTSPPPPADPFDCFAGFANWQAGWSVAKKEWCCKVHGKGCAIVTGCTTSEPFDCDAGFANWQRGWSIPKKQWCCANKGKGCEQRPGGCT